MTIISMAVLSAPSQNKSAMLCVISFIKSFSWGIKALGNGFAAAIGAADGEISLRKPADNAIVQRRGAGNRLMVALFL